MKKKVGFKNSRLSPEDYFQWRKERSKNSVEKIDNLIGLKNKQILDIGCGFGSLSSLLFQKKANVTATEIDTNKINYAKKILGGNVKIVKVTDERLPFKDSTFDVVFLFDVIEHVSKPNKIISETYRVLKPGGLIYIEFTPYYSISGHHLYDYTKLPIHILLPKSKIKKIVFTKKVNSFLTPVEFWELFESLNKIKISYLYKIMNKFNKIEERFIIKYPDKLELSLPIIKYLPFKDIFTMSYEGIYKK